MPTPKEEPDREDRIVMDIVVDAYDEIERALSWYYYLQDHLGAPFQAQCIAERPISPLRKGEKVEVVGMPPEEECEHEIFVTIRRQQETFAVPLAQLKGIGVDEEAEQAIADWHYWVKRGYQF